MSGISTSLAIRDKFSSTINKATQGVNRMLKSMRDLDVTTIKTSPAKVFTSASDAIDQSKRKLDEFIQKQRKTSSEAKKVVTSIDQSKQALNQFTQKQRQAANEAKKVSTEWGSIGTAIQGAIAAMGANQLINLADSMTNITARLDLMNDGKQSTEELKSMIMDSANSSLASFQSTADAIGKMGVMAKDAFNSNAEVIQFTELINKQFSIAGTSTAGVEAAMLQLTQAMASGVLRGEELNSIFEQAPTIIQTIADSLGVPIGQIRKLAEEGKLTANVVKQAMFAGADDINEKFSQMPMTFAQLKTITGNILLDTFNPIIQTIGKGAQWIYDNWAKVGPIFFGLATAVTIFTTALIGFKIATWLAAEANKAFITSLLKNPFMWIAIILSVIVGYIYNWIQAVGGMKIAWMIVCNSLLLMWDMLKIGFFTGVYFVMDLFNELQMGWMTVVTNIKNWAGDLKVSVLTTLQDLVNGAIDVINGLINMANKIPGVNIEVVDKVTFGASAQIENEIAKQARNAELSQYKNDINKKISDRQTKLDAMKSSAKLNYASRQAEIAAAQASKASKAASGAGNAQKFDTSALTSAKNSLGNIDKVGEVGKIKDDVNIGEEDLQMMKDVAEMRYTQNFVTLTPTVAMQASISEKVDVNNVINGIVSKLEEEFATSAAGHYA